MSDWSEERLDALISAAAASGFTIDFLEALTQGLDLSALAIVLGNASKLPQYMKSSDNPYVSRSTSAPFKEMR